MMERILIEKALKKLRKESLLLKREQTEKASFRKSLFEERFEHERYEFVSPSEAIAAWIVFENSDVGSLLLSRDTPIEILDSQDKVDERLTAWLNEFSENDHLCFVYPFDWKKYGSILTSFGYFMKNFSEMTFLIDDGFILFDCDISSAIYFRGERAPGSEELVYGEYIASGV